MAFFPYLKEHVLYFWTAWIQILFNEIILVTLAEYYIRGYITKLPHIWHNCSGKPFKWKAKISIGANEEYRITFFVPSKQPSCLDMLAKWCLQLGLLWKLKQKTYLLGIKSAAWGNIFSRSFLILNINDPLTHCFNDTYSEIWSLLLTRILFWIFCYWIFNIWK